MITIKDYLRYDSYTTLKRYRVWVEGQSGMQGHGDTEEEALKDTIKKLSEQKNKQAELYLDLRKKVAKFFGEVFPKEDEDEIDDRF